MNPPRQRPAPLRAKRIQAYVAAFARLEDALMRNSVGHHQEKIRLLRLALFGEVDQLESAGTVGEKLERLQGDRR